MAHTEIDPLSVLRSVIHELRSGMGAIRLMITSIEPADSDRAYLTEMLEKADKESLRLSKELGALTPLAICLFDESELQDTNLSEVVTRSADAVSPEGIKIKMVVPKAVRVRARSTCLDHGLPALLRLADAEQGELAVSVTEIEELATLSIRNGNIRAPSSLVRNLGNRMGATVEPRNDGVDLIFERAP